MVGFASGQRGGRERDDRFDPRLQPAKFLAGHDADHDLLRLSWMAAIHRARANRNYSWHRNELRDVGRDKTPDSASDKPVPGKYRACNPADPHRSSGNDAARLHQVRTSARLVLQ